MAEYDFSTLNSSDLEELVCDLLNAQSEDRAIKYRTFKDGKDKGIDFLYSTREHEYEHVGQVKHFYRTGYKGLLTVLRNEELAKVQVLNPNKYIFATSVDLSVSNVQEIANLFNPYIKGLNDIYGKKDLNRLLELHDKILTNYYKLWFSDATVLSKILNSDLEFRSSLFTDSEFKRRLRIYVQTRIFREARKSLKKNKFIIITGQPGVGKTTLAEMLVYEYIKDDYKLSYIIDDIKDALRLLTNDNSKQIIYFDDFLGSNEVEINRAKGSETSLRKILRVITSLENKVLVFTTRSFLLNSAIVESENLNRFNIKAHESILQLNEYNENIKMEILKNHIEDSELKDEIKDFLRLNKTESFIISHNFSPRIVEFITNKDIVKDMGVVEYKDFLYSSINSPINIWEHAYNYQIKEDDRLLLNTLLSFGDSANINELKNAFQSRIDFEVQTNNKRKEILAFNKALRRLNEGFLIFKNNGTTVHFINPSLTDFLIAYIKTDYDEVMHIAKSVRYTSQLTKRLFSLSSGKEEMPIVLKERLLEDYSSFISNRNRDGDLIQLAMVIYKYINTHKGETVVCQIISEIDDWSSLHEDYSLNVYFREFLETIRGNTTISMIVEKRLVDILSDLTIGEDDILEAVDLLEDFIQNYNLNLRFLDTKLITEHFEELLSDYIYQEIDELKELITTEGEEGNKKTEILGLITRMNKLGLNINQSLEEFDKVDWYDVAVENEFKRQMEKDD
ncbi:ATP-binding protein [uncultured Bacteroides sp.]|uniref:ATP-binding protein n=1 Tax=uncultured Bacteroides sp. TaxID=162156 RepID=UPI002AA6145F|nr:ATP-binding protein [uncultured Bacteroides sp.]